MTTRTHLPYDVARCIGVKKKGKLVNPCATCARQHFLHQVNGFMQAYLAPPVLGGRCSHYIDMEMNDS